MVPAVLAQLLANAPMIPNEAWKFDAIEVKTSNGLASPTHGQANFTILSSSGDMSALAKEVSTFFDWLGSNQEELGSECAMIIHDNAWDLFETS